MSSRPPAIPPKDQVKSYSFADLPPKYRKRYDYAARFVRLVRSKTPKVTMYTKHAKCMLMENSPSADFEVNFYNGTLYLMKIASFFNDTYGEVRIKLAILYPKEF